MENAIEVRSGKKEQAYKFIQYSAHDGTLHALFAALRLDSDHQEFRGKMNLQLTLNFAEKPNYGAALFFELHEQEGQPRYFVRVQYSNCHNCSQAQFALKSLGKGCESNCPFETFKS